MESTQRTFKTNKNNSNRSGLEGRDGLEQRMTPFSPTLLPLADAEWDPSLLLGSAHCQALGKRATAAHISQAPLPCQLTPSKSRLYLHQGGARKGGQGFFSRSCLLPPLDRSKLCKAQPPALLAGSRAKWKMLSCVRACGAPRERRVLLLLKCSESVNLDLCPPRQGKKSKIRPGCKCSP